MRKSKRSKAVKTNMAIRPLSDSERIEVLERTTFGSDWDEWVDQIEDRIKDVPEEAPLKQSTRRALAMIKDMMLERA